MFRVVIEGGPHPAPRYNLKEGVPVSLGSGEEDDLQVAGEWLAEGHLSLRAEGHTVFVEVREGAPSVLLDGREGTKFEVKSGDHLEVGGLRLTFAYVVFALGDGKRRTSRMQHLTALAVGAVLVLEIGFILAFSLFKTSNPGVPERVEPVVEAASVDPAPEPLRPALFIRSVDSEAESDNQGVFDILQVTLDIGSRRELSAGEQDTVFLEGIWEVEGEGQTWEERDAFASLPSQTLDAEQIRSPQVLTLLVPREGSGGVDLTANRVRVRITLSLGGQEVDQRTVTFKPSDQPE